jgi:hypothetical protein
MESLALIDPLFTVVFPNKDVSVFTVTMQQLSACLLRKNVSPFEPFVFAFISLERQNLLRFLTPFLHSCFQTKL